MTEVKVGQVRVSKHTGMECDVNEAMGAKGWFVVRIREPRERGRLHMVDAATVKDRFPIVVVS